MSTIICTCCGEPMDALLDVGANEPGPLLAIPEDERAGRVKFNQDLCVIDGESHFIRAVLPIPVPEIEDTFKWGVWVSLSEQNFQRYFDSFDDEDQSKLGGMFGWLCTALPGYEPMTLSLKTDVWPQDDRQRPEIFVQAAHDEHPLYIEQQFGISKSRLAEIISPYLHHS